MNLVTYAAGKASYPLCILVADMRQEEIRRSYLAPQGINPDNVMLVQIRVPPGKKRSSAADTRQWFAEQLGPALVEKGVKYLLIGDAETFKTVCKTQTADDLVGFLLPTELGPWTVGYLPNYRTLWKDPVKVGDKIRRVVSAVRSHVRGEYREPGRDIIKEAYYPRSFDEIAAMLEGLHDHPELTLDIEAFNLSPHLAGVGTVGFAWDKGRGVSFPVDYRPIPGATAAPYGVRETNPWVRFLLKRFLTRYEGKLTFHNAGYDVSALVASLWMRDILDNEGLLEGLEILTRRYEDTKLVTYLATNSCAGNKLGLKDQAHEYAGNYAQEEITNILAIPLDQLLEYNLKDCLCTWFVKGKHWDGMVRDDQLPLYEDLFKPAQVDIIQAQLTGMPLEMDRVLEVEQILLAQREGALLQIAANRHVLAFESLVIDEFVAAKNAEYKEVVLKSGEVKRKRITRDDLTDKWIQDLRFNPRSGDQVRRLLYTILGLPVLARTDKGQAATGGDELKDLLSHAGDPDTRELVQAMVDYLAVRNLLDIFMPAFKRAMLGPDGCHYLFGNFNLGGTVSGRLSSSKPNLQNIPANADLVPSPYLLGKYGAELAPFLKKGKLHVGKLIKSCFRAPKGWFFVGIDFDSLEDRISALTTKDPQKLKVYTDGYDGHCLRAYAYWGHLMPDIDPTSVESINSIAEDERYKHFRQAGKTPTFALTYQGTWVTIMANCGFTKEEAQMIERNYHELYVVSDQVIEAHLQEAQRTGYVTGAFGLKLRTPLLNQVVRNTSKTPFEAAAEGRTAGNALGQSWCLLNSRAMTETMRKVRADPYMRNRIRPSAQIHDANYFLVKDDIMALAWLNQVVVEACRWQDHPAIAHDQVKLGGKLNVFYPDWSKEMPIPNGASEHTIRASFREHLEALAA